MGMLIVRLRGLYYVGHRPDYDTQEERKLTDEQLF